MKIEYKIWPFSFINLLRVFICSLIHKAACVTAPKLTSNTPPIILLSNPLCVFKRYVYTSLPPRGTRVFLCNNGRQFTSKYLTTTSVTCSTIPSFPIIDFCVNSPSLAGMQLTAFSCTHQTNSSLLKTSSYLTPITFFTILACR